MSEKIPLEPLDPLRRYSVAQSLRYLGICRKTLYNDINAGVVKTIKAGSRRFVPGSELVRLCSVPT